MVFGVRDAEGGGGAGGACAPQVLGYQLTLFGPRGADYARHIASAPSPSFWTMRRLYGLTVLCLVLFPKDHFTRNTPLKMQYT